MPALRLAIADARYARHAADAATSVGHVEDAEGADSRSIARCGLTLATGRRPALSPRHSIARPLGRSDLAAWSSVAVLLSSCSLITMLAYGKLWFQAYMSNARVSMLEPDRHEPAAGQRRRDRARQDHGHAGRRRQRSGDGHHHAPARGPLPGRRQRAERDQRDHRRASGRHRSRLRSRRGHRPGRPRRARRRADERLSQGDRLPRPDQVASDRT